MIIPARLEIGDTVGIIAPSRAPLQADSVSKRIKSGTNFLESLGLKVKFAQYVYDNEFYGGASLENRIKDIHDMFSNPEIKMIMMVVGGQYINLILDQLDYNLIKNNPKIFSGFSDGTLLTNAIYEKCNIQTYLGLNLADGLGFNISAKMKQNFINTFFNKHPIILTENKELNFVNWRTGEKIEAGYSGWNIIKNGKASGKLTGGLLQRLVTTDYAGFEVDYNKRIVFIESTFDLRNIIILLSSMKQKGIFDKINGLILGYCSTLENQKDLADFTKFLLKEYAFPIIQIGELGHNVESYSYPIGAKAEINTYQKNITIYRA
jgi:muramoyltetrapeptide carboxypeptidase